MEFEAIGARHFVCQGHVVGAEASIYVDGVAWLTWDAVCSSETWSHLPLPTFTPWYLNEHFFRSVNSTSLQFVFNLTLAKASLLSLES